MVRLESTLPLAATAPACTNNTKQSISFQDEMTMNEGMGANRNEDINDDEEDTNDDASVDLLKTQDEYSEGDEFDEDEHDDDFFALKKASSPDTEEKADKTGQSASSVPSPSTHDSQRNDTLRHGATTIGTRSSTAGSSNSDICSPATRTLHRLSEQSSQSELRYNIAQMEEDATSVMLQLSKNKVAQGSTSKSPQRQPKRSNHCNRTMDGKVSSSSTTKASAERERDTCQGIAEVNDTNEATSVEQGHGATQVSEAETSKGSTSSKAVEQPRAGSNQGRPVQHVVVNNQSTLPQAHGLEKQSRQAKVASNTTTNPYQNLGTSTCVTNQKKLQPPPATAPTTKPKAHLQLQAKQTQQPTSGRRPQASVEPPVQQQKTTTTKTTIARPVERRKGQLTDLFSYDVLHIVIPVEGTLGVSVQREYPPADLLTGSNCRFARIKDANENSIGYNHGLRAGDWLFADNATQFLALYEEFLQTVRMGERPLQFYVARRKPSQEDALDPEIEEVVDQVVDRVARGRLGALDQDAVQCKQRPPPSVSDNAAGRQRANTHANCKTTNKSTKQSRLGDANANLNLWDSSSDEDDDDDDKEKRAGKIVLPNQDKVVPFCKLCQALQHKKRKKQSPRAVHHPLCPRNDFFEDSKADTILQDMINGMKLGCDACAKAYKLGKNKPGEDHIESCPCYNQQHASAPKAGGKANKNSSAGAAAKKKRKPERDTGKSKQGKNTSTASKKAAQHRTKTTTPSKRVTATGVGQKTGKPSLAARCVQHNEQGASSATSIHSHTPQTNNRDLQSKRNVSAAKQQPLGISSGNRFGAPLAIATAADAAPKPAADRGKQPIKATGARSLVPGNTTASRGVVSPPGQNQPKPNEVANSKRGSDMLLCAALEKPALKRPSQQLAARRDASIPRPGPAHLTDATKKPSSHTTTDQTDMTSARPTTAPVPVGCPPAALNRAAGTPTTPSVDTLSASSNLGMVAPSEGSGRSGSGRCKTKWIPHENPWGPQGFLLGDVTILTHRVGLGHHETLLPSERYERNPFADSSNYKKTHRTPQEGLHFVRLQRDALAERSWGFTVRRHEFGGGCLVGRVDPMSPAEGAAFVAGMPASGNSAALKVNDMIIAINGISVGGMTEIGVEIELETSGPSMCLVVSRYRYADQLMDRIVEAEENVASAIDEAVNDDRNLDWVHANAATALASPPLLALASKVLDHQLQVRTDNGNPTNRPSKEMGDEGMQDVTEETKFPQADTESPRNHSSQPGAAHGSLLQQSMTGHGEETVTEFAPGAGHSETDTDAMDIDEDAPAEASQVGNTDTSSSLPLPVRIEADETPRPPREGGNETVVRFKPSSTACKEGGPGKIDGSKKIGSGLSTLRVPSRVRMLEAAGDKEVMETEATDVPPMNGTDVAEQSQPTPMDIDGQEHHASKAEGSSESNAVADEGATREGEDGDDTEEEDDDDGNPALGCVCGTIHDKRCVVFWVQCDSCDAWYNVARKCVGFSAKQAETRTWSCWACSPPEDDDDEEDEKRMDHDEPRARQVAASSTIDCSDSDDESSIPPPVVFKSTKRSRRGKLPTKVDPKKELPRGTMVDVDREGSHKFGGSGEIKDSYLDEDGIWRYSVRYTIHRYTEHDISAEYVLIHN